MGVGKVLSYQKPEQRHRRLMVRTACAVAVAIALIVLWKQARRAWPGIVTWRAYRAAAVHTHPPGLAVYDASDAAVAAVDGSDPTLQIGMYRPTQLRGIWQPTNNTVQVAVRESTELQTLAGRASRMAWGRPAASVFLHERTTPGGRRFLVDARISDSSGPCLFAYTHVPATLSQGPTQHASASLHLQTADPNLLTVYAGQPDPNDPTRFTIDYNFAGKPGVITGVVNRQGGVEFSASSGWVVPTRDGRYLNWHLENYADKQVFAGEPTKWIQPERNVGAVTGGRGFYYTPDGSMLIALRTRGVIDCFAMPAGKEVLSLRVEPLDFVRAIVVSRDGKRLAAAGENGIYVWSLPEGKLTRTIPVSGWFADVAFTPDGSGVISGDRIKSTLYCWDVDSGEIRFQQPIDGRIGTIAASADAIVVAVHPDDYKLSEFRVLDLEGQPRATTRPTIGPQVISRFSDDGKYLTATGAGGLATVLDGKTLGTELQRFPQQEDYRIVWASKISPAGNAFAAITASPNDEITTAVWDFPAGKTVWLYRDPDREATIDLAFSPDGKTLATLGRQGTIKLWKVGEVAAITRPSPRPHR
jgi:WD40 repeat protein